MAVGCGPDEPSNRECVEPPARPTGTVIAGSGATLPLTRELVALYQTTHPDRPIRLAQSIGTGGALRAIADGAIDLGLASRSVHGEAVDSVTLTHAPLRIAAHPQVPDRDISWEFLLAAAEGEAHWSDGTPAVFIHREPGDSGIRVLTAGSPALSEAIGRGRESALLIAYTDADALQQLTSVPGAIGLHDPVATRLVGAHVADLTVGDAPDWHRALSVFWLPDGENRPHFVEFLGSEPVAQLLESLGYAHDAQ